MSVKSVMSSPKSLALIGQAVASGGNFALGVLLARWLGVTAFGQYSVLWLGVLFALGLHQAYFTQPLMALFHGKNEHEKTGYLQALTGLQVLLSTSVAVSGVTIYWILLAVGYERIWLDWLPIMAVLLGGFLFQDYLKKYCYAKRIMHVPLMMDVVLFVLLLTSLSVLNYLGELSLGRSLFAMMVTYGISNALGHWFLGMNPFKGLDKKTLMQTAKEHYHYSVWLLGTSMVQWFSGNFFLVAAAGTLGAVAVGALRMAQNMVGLCHVLFLAIENLVPAEAARQFFTKGEKGLFNYLKRVGLLGSIPVTALLLGLTLAAPWLMARLYGAEYQAFAYLVAAFSVVYALGYVLTILRIALRSMHHTSPMFIGYLASAGVSILVATPVVRHWGIGGVMAGLIGSQMLLLMVYLAFILKKQPASSMPQSPAMN